MELLSDANGAEERIRIGVDLYDNVLGCCHDDGRGDAVVGEVQSFAKLFDGVTRWRVETNLSVVDWLIRNVLTRRISVAT